MGLAHQRKQALHDLGPALAAGDGAELGGADDDGTGH